MGNSTGNGLLKQLPIAYWPSGPPMELPLGWHHQGGPTQLLGSAANSGISAAGTAVEEQMHQAATTAGEQHRGNPLLGPGQITATTCCDHQ